MIYCNKDASQEASSQTPFLPLGFAFTTLYICQPDYSGGEDESMDGDINKYLVLAIICVGGLSGLVASQSTGRNFPPATANKTVGR
ncbi:hypothetical protein I3I74_001655 [Shigella flexneri]|nr:hypothetical protein [Shigella flexneri]EHA9782318.1 hypothetical protein [Shigella flexneri]EHA9952431.1 hypothetical protein [Shigella flexneri]EHB2478600.1 hypothetical protein [Shigella flexneri]